MGYAWSGYFAYVWKPASIAPLEVAQKQVLRHYRATIVPLKVARFKNLHAYALALHPSMPSLRPGGTIALSAQVHITLVAIAIAFVLCGLAMYLLPRCNLSIFFRLACVCAFLGFWSADVRRNRAGWQRATRRGKTLYLH